MTTTKEIRLKNTEMFLIVGTYTKEKSKGIQLYRFDTATGKAIHLYEEEVSNPSFVEVAPGGKYVYSVSENTEPDSTLASAFVLDKEKGILRFINQRSTGGGSPCNICIEKNGENMIIPNYSGTSIVVFSTGDDGALNPASEIINFKGQSINPERQEESHPHCAAISPDGKYAFVTDLGADKIYKFIIHEDSDSFLTIGKPSEYKTPAGSGPRLITFHPNGKYMYVVTELSDEILTYKYKNGNLEMIQQIKANDKNAQGGADIHISPDGNFLYASVRLKEDGIAIFAIGKDGKLEKTGYQKTGKHPRSFILTPDGKLLLVANRDTDNIQVFRRDSETGFLENLNQDICVSMPVCLKLCGM